MKKMLKKINSKITFFNYFLGATVIGIVVLSITIFCNVNYVKKLTKSVKKSQIQIEHVLKDIKSQSKNIIINNYKDENLSNDNFMREYYTIQSEWLNKWLTALAIIMAILGIMIPICFVKFLENKEKEMDRIIADTKIQNKDMESHVREMESQLKKVEKESNEITLKSQKMSQELEEVKDYVATAQAEAIYMEASDDYKNGDYDQAIQLLYKAKKYKNLDKICYLLGKCFFFKNYINKAIAEFSESLNINKINDEALNHISRCYHHKKMYKEAIENINKAIDLNPKKDIYKIHRMLYYVSSDKNKYKNEAEKFLKLYHQLYSHSKMTLNMLGLIATKINDYDLAIDLLNESCMWDKKPYPQYYNLTRAYIMKGLYADAIDNLEKYIKIDAKNENLGIYDDDYNIWKNQLLSSEQNEYTEKLLELLEKMKVSKRSGDGEDD